MDRLFTVESILVSLGIGVLGALIALIYRLAKGDGASALWRAMEALLLAFAGATIARLFIGILLLATGETPAAQTVIGLLFFIVPGLINLVSLAFGDPVFGTDGLLWFALIVGGVAGAYDGIFAIHRWKGLGVFSFLLDMTWGLAGTTVGIALHLVNTGWGRHADDPVGHAWSNASETRQSAHRYVRGFSLKPALHFAFTQGSVMSHMTSNGVTSGLHRHESIHVWQNRLLGPFFWFSYVGWMLMLLVPGLIAGLVSTGQRVAQAIEWWCYFNNPWEIMAYGIANPAGRTGQPGGHEAWLCWPWVVAMVLGAAGVSLLALAFFGVVSAGLGN